MRFVFRLMEYALYGLTEAEIAIVGGDANRQGVFVRYMCDFVIEG